MAETIVRLKVDEIKKRLKKISGWGYRNRAIEKEFERKDFLSAMQFVDEIKDHAERFDHYPDIYIHDGCKVRITLYTADEGGVTDRDFVLAKLIDSFAKTEELPELNRPVG